MFQSYSVFFVFVAEFVILPGKNIGTSDAKRRGSPNNRTVATSFEYLFAIAQT